MLSVIGNCFEKASSHKFLNTVNTSGKYIVIQQIGFYDIIWQHVGEKSPWRLVAEITYLHINTSYMWRAE